jgi:hypothetical protein
MFFLPVGSIERIRFKEKLDEIGKTPVSGAT